LIERAQPSFGDLAVGIHMSCPLVPWKELTIRGGTVQLVSFVGFATRKAEILGYIL
jgi:hypothetical protein